MYHLNKLKIRHTPHDMQKLGLTIQLWKMKSKYSIIFLSVWPWGLMWRERIVLKWDKKPKSCKGKCWQMEIFYMAIVHWAKSKTRNNGKK